MSDIQTIRDALEKANKDLVDSIVILKGFAQRNCFTDALEALDRIEKPRSVICHVCKKDVLPEWVDDQRAHS